LFIFWQAGIFHNRHYDTIFVKGSTFGKVTAKKQRSPDFIEHGVQYVLKLYSDHH